MTKTFYITTPIYYANSMPHLGHLYSTIVADVIQRHKKQRGFDTYFLTGTDEHGINIQRAAEKNNRTPKEQVEYISGELKRMFHDFQLDTENGGYDVFMRTTELFHYEGVQHLWQEIAKKPTPKGNTNIYLDYYKGWFCAPCAEYKTEDERNLELSPQLSVWVDRLLAEVADESEKTIAPWLKQTISEGLVELRETGLDHPSLPLLDTDLTGKTIKEDYGKDKILPFFKYLEVALVNEEFPRPSESLLEAFYELKNFISANDLVYPRCPVHGTQLDIVGEASYFFRLSDYNDWLLKTIEDSPDLVQPAARRNEVLTFIRGGLQDLSISRMKTEVPWGVPVPDDDDHVMYVWLDALSNYITAIGYGNNEKASVGFEKYWQNAMHLVGKDILRFHTVYWFSFLSAAGLPLPKAVYAHGMWLDADGRKMGKTTGNVIEVDVLHEYFQVDVIRYFVLREMVFGQDGKFSYENLIERANADLASGLGNLASRTFSMITKYRDGLIPNGKIAEENYLHARRAGIDPDGQDLVSVIEHARDEFLRRFDNFEFSQALETLWTVIARVDKLISDAKPWELIKDDKQSETLNAVLYRASETLRWLCVMLYPVMPKASKNIYGQIGLKEDIAKLDPADLKWGHLSAGTKIGETVGVFPRIDKNKVMNEIKESVVSSPSSLVTEPVASPVTKDEGQMTNDNFITIDDFTKVELRVGEIKVAERVPDADKLLRFEVDLGEDQPRQILAGLAEYYEPEKLIGRKVVVVANLKPRKMRGLESQGMICAASLNEEDTPAIATFLEDVTVGARLK
ncbi:MAG: methionine--tRNA ligase subunit beta [Pyrinomonadaceae bacterium]